MGDRPPEPAPCNRRPMPTTAIDVATPATTRPTMNTMIETANTGAGPRRSAARPAATSATRFAKVYTARVMP